jgi:hypothetical protein
MVKHSKSTLKHFITFQCPAFFTSLPIMPLGCFRWAMRFHYQHYQQHTSCLASFAAHHGVKAMEDKTKVV